MSVLSELYKEDRKTYDKLLELSAGPDFNDSALGHPDLLSYAILAFKVQDLANLHTVTHSMKGVRNHGVAIRRLLAKEAKRIRGES